MPNTFSRATLSTVAVASAFTLVTACGSAPEDNAGGGSASGDFTPCMVSDSGGVDDK